MDWNRVNVFLKVVEQGGFTAAARELHLPKSSVSRTVAMLEEELGARLLQRSTRKVELTEAGRTFYDRAALAMAGLEEAAGAVLELSGSLRGVIRITAPLDAGVALLAPLVARFAVAHPGVHVEAILTNRIVDLVGEGVDFALRVAELPDSSLIARKLARIDTGLFAAPAYLARRGTPTTVAALAEHDCVLFRATHGRSRWTLTGPNGEETADVQGGMSGDDYAFVVASVLAGAGIGLLPEFLTQDAERLGTVVRLLPQYRTPHGFWHLVYPSARFLPRRSAVFRDFLVEAVAERCEQKEEAARRG